MITSQGEANTCDTLVMSPYTFTADPRGYTHDSSVQSALPMALPDVIFLNAGDLSMENPGGVHSTIGGPLLKAPEINKQSLNILRPRSMLKMGPFPPENPAVTKHDQEAHM